MTKDLSPQAKIERLAAEVMGWEKKNWTIAEQFAGKDLPAKDRGTMQSVFGFYKNGKPVAVVGWNPIDDENHFRQVLLKVMDIPALYHVLLDQWGDLCDYIESTLPERVDALLSALDSLSFPSS